MTIRCCFSWLAISQHATLLSLCAICWSTLCTICCPTSPTVRIFIAHWFSSWSWHSSNTHLLFRPEVTFLYRPFLFLRHLPVIVYLYIFNTLQMSSKILSFPVCFSSLITLASALFHNFAALQVWVLCIYISLQMCICMYTCIMHMHVIFCSVIILSVQTSRAGVLVLCNTSARKETRWLQCSCRCAKFCPSIGVELCRKFLKYCRSLKPGKRYVNVRPHPCWFLSLVLMIGCWL